MSLQGASPCRGDMTEEAPHVALRKLDALPVPSRLHITACGVACNVGL